MKLEERLRPLLSPILMLGNNPISLAGVVFATTGGVLWILVVLAGLGAETANPYQGVLAFLILPAVFFTGLILIPLGALLKRRRMRQRGLLPSPDELQHLNWENPDLRRLVQFVGITTVFNFIIGSHFVYEGFQFMDSTTFCGQVCHRVMIPEYTAYLNSPHSRVPCVDCHIGPGATWFVKSKLSGVPQVFHYIMNDYPRPIPTPIEDLRPARETCETCHWPQKFGADRLRILPKYADDETNTATKTVLLMRIGGGNSRRGIHGAHLGEGIEIWYAPADSQRMEIPKVIYEDKLHGRRTVYYSSSADKAEVDQLPLRLMDCMDCHNRPTHAFDLPEQAVNQAMEEGRISAELPYAKREAMRLLTTEYTSRQEAQQKIVEGFVEFYRENYPEIYAKREEVIRSSGEAIAGIYLRNVFPEMNISWGTYPNHIGHTNFPGCFRCHDADHVSEDGERVIQQDCSSCHVILAMEEPEPEILQTLGLAE